MTINEWLEISEMSGKGNAKVTLTALQNDGEINRSTQLVVKGRYGTKYVNVRQKMDPTFFDRKYFWVEFEETGGVIENKIKNDEMAMYHSFDGIVWEPSPKTLSMGEYTKVYFKNNSLSLSNSNNIWQNEINFSKYASIGGNLGSITDMYDYCCYNLFVGNTYLRHAHDLIIPWVNVADSCFVNMFYGCTSLETAPELPSTTLASNCYNSMFTSCHSLEIAPSLPATTLATNCYNGMFTSCHSLTTAPELPATILEEGCYNAMFMGCHSLTTAPELPATILEKECYLWMFYDCTSLTTAPELPATTLAEDCYYNMFGYCESLVNAPQLPATTLSPNCYLGMFENCTSLVNAPELLATELAESCYEMMFYGCTNLNYIKMLATDISAISCLEDWVANVAENGTFVKHPDMNDLPSGNSGIPVGWTVIDS